MQSIAYTLHQVRIIISINKTGKGFQSSAYNFPVLVRWCDHQCAVVFGLWFSIAHAEESSCLTKKLTIFFLIKPPGITLTLALNYSDETLYYIRYFYWALIQRAFNQLWDDAWIWLPVTRHYLPSCVTPLSIFFALQVSIGTWELR